jgi:hypothetical protein
MMHQDDRAACAGNAGRRAIVIGKGGDVVDDGRAGAERRVHNGCLARVDGHGGAGAGELLDDGQDALDLVAFPHRLCTGAGGLAADIDDRGSRGGHGVAGGGGSGRIVVPPSVGKAVGRDVEDADDLRLVEPDRAIARLKR